MLKRETQRTYAEESLLDSLLEQGTRRVSLPEIQNQGQVNRITGPLPIPVPVTMKQPGWRPVIKGPLPPPVASEKRLPYDVPLKRKLRPVCGCLDPKCDHYLYYPEDKLQGKEAIDEVLLTGEYSQSMINRIVKQLQEAWCYPLDASPPTLED